MTVVLPVIGRITLHKKLENQFRGFFQDIQDRELSGLIQNQEGIYNCRRVKLLGGGYGRSWSRHAWGIAIDINTISFPYGTRKTQDERLLKTAKKHGFANAYTDFNLPDPHHFEFFKFVDYKKEEVEDMAISYRPTHTTEEIHDGIRHVYTINGFFSDYYGWKTGIRILNETTTDQDIAGDLYDTLGNLLQSKGLNLSAGEVATISPASFGIKKTFKGYVKIRSKVELDILVKEEK